VGRGQAEEKEVERSAVLNVVGKKRLATTPQGKNKRKKRNQVEAVRFGRK